MKHITNHKYLALAVAITAVFALAGCGGAVKAENTVPETEALIKSTEQVENTEATEAFVPETEVTEIESESTETVEPKSETESTEVRETETTLIEDKASPKAETPEYTFTEMNTTMYAKSSVNVRSLPSTDGTRVGSLSTNQEVTVTGQCNETGWYRIACSDGEAYVSDKYLSDTKLEEVTSTSAADANTAANVDASTDTNANASENANTSASESTNVTQAQTEDPVAVEIWTASNGVVLYVMSDGGIRSAIDDLDLLKVAWAEYDACHPVTNTVE